MYRIQKIIIFLFLCLLLMSCNKHSPQLPSNKGNVADKNTVSLLVINQNLAKKEDKILKQYVLHKVKTFKKSEIGFWYTIDKMGNGPKIKDSVVCKFSFRLQNLNGKLLQNDVKQIVIGKKQVVVGLEEGLKLMNKGESATFIIPWYLAYGMKGNGILIPPYSSIIYEIKVYN